MTQFNHAYSLGFAVISEREDASDVTHEMLMEAILQRLAALQAGHVTDPRRNETLVDACDAPWDTFEEGNT